MQIFSVGDELAHADGQTGGRTARQTHDEVHNLF